MGVVFGLLWLFTGLLQGVHGQGVYAPPTVRIVHSGQACNVEEERYSERVYTIKEGETLELQCLVTGHPRPQRPAEVPESPLSGATVEPLSFRKDSNHTATKKKSKKPREEEKSHRCL